MRLLALALLLLSLPCAARDAATDRTAATARAAAATRSAWVGTNALRGYDARGPADSTYARGRLVRNLLAGAYDPNAAGSAVVANLINAALARVQRGTTQ